MRLTRAAWRSRARGKRRVDRQAPAHSERVDRQSSFDRWAASAAAGSIIAVLAAVYFAGSPLSWSYQVLMLCLVAAAAAGRALVGFRGPGETAGPALSLRRSGWLLTLIAAAAVLPHAHGLTVGFLGDDFVFAAAMSEVRSAAEAMSSPVFNVFYRPLSLLLWWLGAQLWGGAPLGYHILNLVIHAANSVLVYLVGRRLIGSQYGAVLAALLFAVHPLYNEPVILPQCISDLVCTTLSLLSLLCLEIYVAASAPWRRRLALSGALAAFLLALLNKEAALALPGFVVLRLVLVRDKGRCRDILRVGAGYGAMLAVYLALRISALGHFGGYSMSLSLWNTVFPTQPLRIMGSFFFPVQRELFSRVLGAWVWGAVMALMAAGVFWWVQGLTRVPGRRLWLWTGYLLIMAMPVWTIEVYITGHLLNSRFAYLPTVGLAWLFGDICAGRGRGWRRSGAVAAVTLLLAAALTAWYVRPWREASRLADEVLAAGVRLVEELPESPGQLVLYVRDLPTLSLGAPVFDKGFSEELPRHVQRPVLVYTLGLIGGGVGAKLRVTGDVLDQSVLLAGEYDVAWRPESGRMEILRVGEDPVGQAMVEGEP